MVKVLGAKFVFLLHLASIVYLVLGWLLPLQWLIFHIISVPLVMLQWKFNNDQCVLTQLQMKLEGKTIAPDEQGQFIKSLFEKLNMSLSEAQLFWVVYGLMLVSLGLSLLRYAL